MSYQIAIDGPAGAGKSTIAKIVAAKKGFIYVDTGAMYRAMAIFLLENKVDVNDEASVSEICQKANVELKFSDGTQQVYLNGRNVTSMLRTEEVGNAASTSSKYAKVRERLTVLQKKIAEENSVVMDGRDIGTVVLPNANVKIFLTASSAVRAKRRYDELLAKGQEADLKKIEEDIVKRDEQDSSRANAPLKQAEDAYLVDSSDLSIDEVAEKILGYCD